MAFGIAGQIAEQAATGSVVGGVGSNTGGRRGRRPRDEIEAIDGIPPHDGRGPLIPPIPILRDMSNVETNRYKDNKNDKDNPKCKIFRYGDKDKECPDGQAHHIVPDRCWRAPGKRGAINTGVELIDDAVDDLLQEVLPWRKGGYYYGEKMDEKKGWAICVTKKQHDAIHFIHNRQEKLLGENGDPKWVATLGQLENIGADAVSEVTGCNRDAIKKKLQEEHENVGLQQNTLVRADPSGRSGLTMEKFAELRSNKIQDGSVR